MIEVHLSAKHAKDAKESKRHDALLSRTCSDACAEELSLRPLRPLRTKMQPSHDRGRIRAEHLQLPGNWTEIGQCRLQRATLDVAFDVDEEHIFPLGAARRA